MLRLKHTIILFLTILLTSGFCAAQQPKRSMPERKFVNLNTGCPMVDVGEDVIMNCHSTSVILEATFQMPLSNIEGYTVSGIPFEPPYAFDEGNPILVQRDDLFSEIIELPFGFCFFDETYHQIVAGANGIITFDTTLANQFCDWQLQQNIPDTAFPILNSISGVYQDIFPNPETGGAMFSAVLGEYPCRSYVVNWHELPLFSCGEDTTNIYQMVLYEGTNIIDIYVRNRTFCSGWNEGRGVIGIINEDGSEGCTPPYRNTGKWYAENESWRFTPYGSENNYSIDWFIHSVDDNNLVSNDLIYEVSPTENTRYIARLTYTSCGGDEYVLFDTINVEVPKPIIGAIHGKSDVTVATDINSGIAHYYLDEIPNASHYEWTLDRDDWGISWNGAKADVTVRCPGKALLTATMFDADECHADTSMLISAHFYAIDEENDQPEIIIFPNPTKDAVFITVGKQHETIEVEVLNHLGMTCDTFQIDASENSSKSYSMLNLPEGLYVFRFSTSSGWRHQAKIIFDSF